MAMVVDGQKGVLRRMKKVKPIVLSRPLPDDWIAPVRAKFDVHVGTFENGLNSEELAEHISRVEGVLTLLSDKVDAALLDKMPSLRVISNMAAGTDNLDLAECMARGIRVGNTPGVLTNATADIAMLLMLMITRKANLAEKDARSGGWKTWDPTGWMGMELGGKALGIVGMGKIGKAVAKRAEAFGMRIYYHNRSPLSEQEGKPNWKWLPLRECLASSDVVSLHCPLTPETTHLVNAEKLSWMKPSAFLINTSRGKVIDQNALADALRDRKIAGAGLDVTDPEPLPLDNRLFTLPNCVIYPHIGSATEDTRRKMAEMACENLIAGMNGDEMPYPVL